MKKLIVFAAIFFNFLYCFSQRNVCIHTYDSCTINYCIVDTVFYVEISDIQRIAVDSAWNVLTRNYKYDTLTGSVFRFHINLSDSLKFRELTNSSPCVVYCSNEILQHNSTIRMWCANKLLVKPKEGFTIDSIINKSGINAKTYSTLSYAKNVFVVYIQQNDNPFICSNTIFEQGLVDYVQPSFHYLTSLDSYNDNPFFSQQWGLYSEYNTLFSPDEQTPHINVIPAWKITLGHGISVAVVDDGIQHSHSDLIDNIVDMNDFTTNPYIPYGQCGVHESHGTACAGVIGAIDNTIGIIGVSPQSQIIALRAMYTTNNKGVIDDDENTIIVDEWLVDAIYYATDSVKADIISCSWHVPYSICITEAIVHATSVGRNNRGTIVVASSGNYNNQSLTDTVVFPALLPNVLSVGGMDDCGFRMGDERTCTQGSPVYSCYGANLDLIAPGLDIVTTSHSSYNTYSGTSMAAPHVAGVAALVLSVDTNLTYQQVFEILCSSATKVQSGYYDYIPHLNRPYGTWNNQTGYGLVNAHHAILKTLYRDYYVTGDSEIGLCETGSYHIHGTTPFNDTITNCWTSSPNIEILSTTDSVIARGIYPGTGWIAFNIIHDNDSLPLYFPITVANGQLSTITNHEITSNTSLSTSYFVDSDLIIDSLATLTITDILYVAGGSRIIVRPGGKLIVNGGTLTSACDGEMWEKLKMEN